MRIYNNVYDKQTIIWQSTYTTIITHSWPVICQKDARSAQTRNNLFKQRSI